MAHLKTSVFVLAALIALGAPAYSQQSQGSKMMDLRATSWLVENVAGHAVPASISVTLSFGTDGRITGSAGCNRFFADYNVSGKDLKLGPVATTRKMCPPPQMKTERIFLDGLKSVAGWRSEGDDVVLATASNQPVVRLKPAKK